MTSSDPVGGRADELRAAVRAKYRDVAASPAGRFSYATGREGALRQGYETALLEGVPDEVVDRFVGVGNPFAAHRPVAGDRVLDVGCGSGLDSLVAARLVGSSGRVVGVDLSPEMLEPARRAAAMWTPPIVGFQEADAERLPFEDAAFDVVISNGALNLVPDKDAAFREIARVLRPGGVLAVADLLVHATVPDDVLADADAWST